MEKGFEKEAEIRFDNLKNKNNRFIGIDINDLKQIELYNQLKANHKRINMWANKD